MSTPYAKRSAWACPKARERGSSACQTVNLKLGIRGLTPIRSNLTLLRSLVPHCGKTLEMVGSLLDESPSDFYFHVLRGWFYPAYSPYSLECSVCPEYSVRSTVVVHGVSFSVLAVLILIHPSIDSVLQS